MVTHCKNRIVCVPNAHYAKSLNAFYRFVRRGPNGTAGSGLNRIELDIGVEFSGFE